MLTTTGITSKIHIKIDYAAFSAIIDNWELNKVNGLTKQNFIRNIPIRDTAMHLFSKSNSNRTFPLLLDNPSPPVVLLLAAGISSDDEKHHSKNAAMLESVLLRHFTYIQYWTPGKVYDADKLQR